MVFHPTGILFKVPSYTKEAPEVILAQFCEEMVFVVLGTAFR
jgi:hypothetical protein